MDKEIKKPQLDFVGVGARRCGTTWLHYCLKEHPEICMSYPRGTSFLSKQNLTTSDFNVYQTYFNHCQGEKLKGEIAPCYLFDEHALVNIKKFFPHIKIIISLRDPIDRVYPKNYTKSSSSKDLDTELVEKFPSYDLLPPKHLYYVYLKKYFETFKKENILILLYDDIKNNPSGVVRSMYEFLGVDSDFTPSVLNKKINSARGVRFLGLQRLTQKAYSLRKHPQLFFFIKKLRLYYLTRIINKLNRKPCKRQKIKKETRNHLKKVFAPDIKKVEKLTGLDLSSWYN